MQDNNARTRKFSVEASVTYTYDLSALNKLRELILIKLQDYVNKYELPYLVSLEKDDLLERIKVNVICTNGNVDCGSVYVLVCEEEPRIFHKYFMIDSDVKANLVNELQEVLDKNPHVYAEWQKATVNVEKLITDAFKKSLSKNKLFDLKYVIIE